MSSSDVTRNGVGGAAPGEEAATGVGASSGGRALPERRRHRKRRAETPMVPEAAFRSYYGMPVVKRPVWQASDIAGYLFLGGLAGASSVIAAAAHVTGRPVLARTLKAGSATATGLSLAALVHDLGRPARFLNMLRTFKPSSPMSVGSWVLSAYGPAAMAAAASDLAGVARPLGAAATLGAGLVGPVVATYTAALVSDTASPAWHEGYRQMPFVFAASAVASAAGLGLAGAPLREVAPVRRLGVVAGTAEVVLAKVMQKRMGLPGEAFEEGAAKRYGRIAAATTASGVALSVLGRRSRPLSALGGAALLAGSAFLRFSVFEAGRLSAEDPRYTVVPQRERLETGRVAGT